MQIPLTHASPATTHWVVSEQSWLWAVHSPLMQVSVAVHSVLALHGVVVGESTVPDPSALPGPSEESDASVTSAASDASTGCGGGASPADEPSEPGRAPESRAKASPGLAASNGG